MKRQFPVSIDVPTGQVSWFGDKRPLPLGDTCPHWCLHKDQAIVAWGPDLTHYEMLECHLCGCRRWNSAEGNELVYWQETLPS